MIVRWIGRRGGDGSYGGCYGRRGPVVGIVAIVIVVAVAVILVVSALLGRTEDGAFGGACCTTGTAIDTTVGKR